MTAHFQDQTLRLPVTTTSATDTSRLWRGYAEAGQGSAAEDQLIDAHISLVKTVVGRLAIALPSGTDLKEFQSAGLRGLLNAIRRFNPRSGESFSSFARLRIHDTVFEEVRRRDCLAGSPESLELQRVMREFEAGHGVVPNVEDMAEAMGLPLPQYQQLLSAVRPATFVSVDSVRGVPDLTDELGASSDLETRIADHIEQLPDLERKVLALYYYEDLRLIEIAEVLGLTEERVGQIHAHAILGLKSILPEPAGGASEWLPGGSTDFPTGKEWQDQVPTAVYSGEFALQSQPADRGYAAFA